VLLDSHGAVVSTALVCPGYTFDSFGNGGPRLSPDQHWVLVDVRGPLSPGNVVRTHALINVRTGGLIFATAFPSLLRVPSTNDGLTWASGERSTLRYADGKTYALVDPPRVPLPVERCALAARDGSR